MPPGTPMIFKLKQEHGGWIVGFGVFAAHVIQPMWLAWDEFEKHNGAESFNDLHKMISDIRSKSADELKEAALSLKKELFNLRFQAASGEAVKISRFREARRDIARIQTVMNDPQQKASASVGKKVAG